tara:strand:- start:25 stop:510 length:486 start_codon:yes stop_codon:yes gene_type:complete
MTRVRFSLRPLESHDHVQVREIYIDAIENLGEAFYSKEQISAWSALACLPGVLDESLRDGKGWLSCSDRNEEIAAFAVRYPSDRLALLYCRSSYGRQGHATTLINHMIQEAQQEGQKYLFTEASFFSYPLLIKLGWQLIQTQAIEIAGVKFKRYLMKLKLA